MKRNKIFLSAITLVIAGLLITSAAGIGMQSVPESANNKINDSKTLALSDCPECDKELIQAEKTARILAAPIAKRTLKAERQTVTAPMESVETVIPDVTGSKGGDEEYLHPAFAEEGKMLTLAYEYHDNIAETEQLIFEVYDNRTGTPISGAYYYPDDNGSKYPSFDFWGYSERFVGAYALNNASVNNGDPVLIRIDDPADNTSFKHRQWGFNNNGWHDFETCEVAGDDSVEFPTNKTDEPWGMTGWIGSTTFTSQDSISSPFIQCPIEHQGLQDPTPNNRYSILGWYYYLVGEPPVETPINDCDYVSMDIDPLGSNFSFPGQDIAISHMVYDWPGVLEPEDPIKWHLGFRWDEYEFLVDYDNSIYLNNADSDLSAWLYPTAPFHIHNPVVSSYDDHIVILFELHDEDRPDDIDIVAWYADATFQEDPQSGYPTKLFYNFTGNASLVASTVLNETSPEIQHLGGDKYQAAFTRTYEDGHSEVIIRKSSNGGQSWGCTYYFPGDAGENVVNEYRNADYGEGAETIWWEYYVNPADPPNSDIDIAAGNSSIPSDNEPIQPFDRYPLDNATDVSVDLDEYWPSGSYLLWGGCDDDGDQITYQVWFDTNNPPVTLINTTIDDFWLDMDNEGLIPLAPETEYFWKIRATDKDGWNESIVFNFTTGTGEVYLCGDCNNDDIINVGDVVYLITYLYRGGSAPIPKTCVGDVNNDDIVNVGDVVYLITYLYRGGSPPNPDCCNPPWP
jgi:hypothetical protein